jgi:transglutaminase-like putative cysteine protease
VPLPPLPAESAPWEAVREAARAGADAEAREARQFLFSSPHAPVASWPRAREYALASFAPGRGIVEAARDLMSRIHKEFVYDSRATTIATPVDEVLQLRRGVCQDFAHVQISCLRALGLPARYVSGYLVTRPPPGKPRLVGADASHAWLAVWVPGQWQSQSQGQGQSQAQGQGQAQGQSQAQGQGSWLPLDPTNDLIPGEQHITVAWGRDYSDVTPVRGVIMGGGRHDLWVSVDVSPGDPTAWEATQTGA